MEIKLSKTTLTLIGVLVIIIIILLLRGCSANQQLEEQLALQEATQAQLTTERTKNGEQVARIELLVADKQKDLLKIKTQDSTIMKLQDVVRDYKGKLASATVIVNTTGDVGSSATVVTKHDTVKEDSLVFIYPQYETEWNDKWSSGRIVASKDSIQREFFVRNEYEITQGWEKQGFLKGKSAVVKVKNLNPNTETEELRSFTVKEKKKRVGIGAGAYYGIDVLYFRPTIVVGVGVSYNLLNF